MKFTSTLRLLTGLGVAGIGFASLSGCAYLGGALAPPEKPPVAAEPAPEASVTDAATEADGDTAVAITANPYLANPKPVAANVEQLFANALELHRKKNWAEAEFAWTELTVTAPELSGPYLNLGIVFEATDRPEAAAQAYQQAIDANPLNIDAYNQLAILKRKAGQFQAAEQLYLQALSVWPDSAISHRNLAILYDLYMGKLSEALAHYEQYQSLASEPDPALKGWISDLRRRLDRNS
ncbi:tetratricopeptide repeat protein [Halioxenophilus sp. WMMB6]|uniref:tetratricopeptide repeat protein n=1 Tax=Halioxenophilus sp. WMMB6 TaxID=3073815 RepID=UPI00295EB80E|nr:tetratricopeptide repeat protein [Halioxenophilus sp. WMMB6]